MCIGYTRNEASPSLDSSVIETLLLLHNSIAIQVHVISSAAYIHF
jgi:hypothetical protein